MVQRTVDVDGMCLCLCLGLSEAPSAHLPEKQKERKNIPTYPA